MKQINALYIDISLKKENKKGKGAALNHISLYTVSSTKQVNVLKVNTQ